MTEKVIGFYNDVPAAAGTARLVIEISRDHIACMVINTGNDQLDAFELFKTEEDSSNWNDLFYETRLASQVLTQSYHNVDLYYNVEEALVIPAPFAGAEAAAQYLSLVFGENRDHPVYCNDTGAEGMTIAYRTRQSVNELAGRYFNTCHIHHSYTPLLKGLMQQPASENPRIIVQFYNHHFIVAVMKQQQLQLVQSLSFQANNDVLYHLLHIMKTYDFDYDSTMLEVSGLIETGSALHTLLQQLFPRFFFSNISSAGALQFVLEQYSPHYFTPFFKLAV